jgi:hypothetical protein
MKFLKLILILSLFIPFTLKSQNSIVLNTGDQNWKQCATGAGAFFANLSEDESGNSDVYFYSNANSNGYLASAYIEGLSISVNQNGYWVVIFSVDYKIIQPKINGKTDGIIHIVHINGYSNVKISWINSTPY